MSDHVEVRYKGQPVEDAAGHLAAITVHRQVFTAPKTAGGIQWRKGEYTDGPDFNVPVKDVALLVRELVSWLEYFASGEVEGDRA